MFQQRGQVTFVFDDGYEQTYDHVLPLLRHFNCVGVFALPLNLENLQKQTNHPLKPYQQWQAITSAGHEIAAHTVTHRDLTTLTANELEHELVEPAKVLGATTIVYPGGGVNTNVARLAHKYYQAGRTVKRGFETLPPADPMQLHSFDYTRYNFQLIKANTRALWAYITNHWLIETYHLVTAQDTTMTHTVQVEDLRSHLHFISRLPITVATIKGTIEQYSS